MKYRKLLTLPCILAVALFGAACQNTLFIGEKHGVNLEVQAQGDATQPVSLNFGFSSHTAIVVPPKEPLTLEELPYGKNVAKGDLLSTISKFRIVHTGSNSITGGSIASGTTLAIQSFVATGDAAEALAQNQKLKNVGNTVSQITANPAPKQ